ASPLIHFQISLSFVSSLSFLRSRIDLSAPRHPMRGAPTQAPAPSHCPDVLHSVEPAHELPAISNVHADEQQSPLSVLPSSQSSPVSRIRSPHDGTRRIWPRISPPGNIVVWMLA